MKAVYSRFFGYIMILGLAALALGGCGGGGGGGGVANSVGGTVSMGYFTSGTVTISSPDGTTFKTTVNIVPATPGTASSTSSTYSVSLGSYSGPIIAKATGTYYDEATGQTITIGDADAIHAALPAASGTVTLPITALTEIAYKQLPATPTAAQITAANTAVSTTFHLDIINTKPVDLSVTGALAAASQAAKDYSLALATISEMANGTPQTAILTSMGADISQGGNLGATNTTSFQTALQNYLTAKGIPASTNITTVGMKTMTVTVSAVGAVTNAIAGVDFIMQLPSGAMVAADYSTGGPAYGVLSTSVSLGATVPSSAMPVPPGYNPTTHTVHAILVSLTTFAPSPAGVPIVVLKVNVPASSNFTSSDFTINPGYSVVDTTPAALPVTLSVSAI